MTIFTLSQAPYICNTIAERDFISSNFPIPEMTSCTIRLAPSTTEVYRWENVSGSFQWVKTFPDQETISWLQTNTNNIASLQSEVSSLSSPSWASITGKPSFSAVATTGNYSDLTGIPASFAPSAHTHTASQISDSSATGRALLTASTTGVARSAIFTPATAIANSATNAPIDCPTNAPTDAPTNYGLLAAILGSDLNTTNAKQNATAANVNAIAGKVNTIGGLLNTLAGKFNLSLDIYRNNGMLSP